MLYSEELSIAIITHPNDEALAQKSRWLTNKVTLFLTLRSILQRVSYFNPQQLADLHSTFEQALEKAEQVGFAAS